MSKRIISRDMRPMAIASRHMAKRSGVFEAVARRRRLETQQCVVSKALVKQCGLTLRSSGAPTAGRQRPAGGTRYIFTVRALASCRCRPLISNVRRRKSTMHMLPDVARFFAPDMHKPDGSIRMLDLSDLQLDRAYIVGPAKPREPA